MISRSNVKFSDSEVRTWRVENKLAVFGAIMRLSLFALKQCVIKQLLDSVTVFCDIRNNQGLGQCYQPQPSAWADNTYLDLD